MGALIERLRRLGRTAPMRVCAIGLGSAAAFVAAHPPMWRAPEDGIHRFPGWDLTRVFWADLEFARRTVAAGELPLWNPLDRGGYAFFAEPQSGMFDVVTWAMIGLALLLGTAPAWLIVLKAVVHYAIAGAGVAAFLRERGAATWAITLGTLGFLWSPRIDKLKDQSALWPTAWVGWLLLATDRCVRGPTPWRGAWLGAAVGVVVCAGYPPAAFRLGLLAVPWAVVVAVTEIRRRRRPPPASEADAEDDDEEHDEDHDEDQDEPGITVASQPPSAAVAEYLRGLAVALAVAVAVGTLMSAGQVWATVSLLPETVRADLAAMEVLASRNELSHAWGVFAPQDSTAGLLVYGSLGLGAGALAGAFAKERAETVLLLVVAGLGFLLACGKNGPLLPHAVKLPGFSSFRIAGHYLTLTAIGVCLGGALGLSRLAQSRGTRRWAPAFAAGFGVSAFVTHAHEPTTTMTLAVLISGALVAALPFVHPRRRPRVGWALVLAVGLDLWTVGRPVADILQPLPPAKRGKEIVRVLSKDRDTRAVFRIANYDWAVGRLGPRFGLRDLVGHQPALTDPRFLALHKEALRSSAVLRAANVSVLATRTKPRGQESTRDLRWIKPHRGLYRVKDPWPLAFWTDFVPVIDRPTDALVWMRMRASPSASLERPLLPDDFDEEHWGSFRDGDRPDPRWVAATLTEQRTNRLGLEIDAPRPGIVVINEAWDAGWRAFVDDEPAPIYRANVLFRGIPVEAGRHRIRLSYDPPGVVALWATWLATALGLLGFAIAAAWRRTRRR